MDQKWTYTWILIFHPYDDESIFVQPPKTKTNKNKKQNKTKHNKKKKTNKQTL